MVILGSLLRNPSKKGIIGIASGDEAPVLESDECRELLHCHYFQVYSELEL